MLKKRRVILLAIVSLLTNFFASAEIYHYGVDNGFKYHSDVPEYVNIINYVGKKKKVTIPTEIEGVKVKSMLGYGKIEKLHIPKGVEVENLSSAKKLKKVTVASGHEKYTVRNNILFNKNKTKLIYAARNIKKVKIPITVTKFERDAFANTKICKFKMPIQADFLSSDMFKGCKSLKEVTLHVGVEEISGGAFEDCVNLKKVSMPTSIKRINAYAFKNCKSLDYYPVPRSAREIEAEAFYGCKSLESVTLSDKVDTIYSKAFAKCTNLKTFKFGAGLYVIEGEYIFKDCKNLKELHVPKTVGILETLSLNSKYLKKIYIYNKKCDIERVEDSWEGKGIKPAIHKKTTIYGYKGSTAQKYAKKNGNKFVAMD